MSEIIRITISNRACIDPLLLGLQLTYQVEHWALTKEGILYNTYEILVTPRTKEDAQIESYA
jgi:hypothetical protein